MNKLGIFVMLHARPGKEAEVAALLHAATPLVEAETGTTNWYSFQSGPATFGIFDTFENEEGRAAHAKGELANTLFQRAQELFVTPPQVQPVDIISEKVQAGHRVPAQHN